MAEQPENLATDADIDAAIDDIKEAIADADIDEAAEDDTDEISKEKPTLTITGDEKWLEALTQINQQTAAIATLSQTVAATNSAAIEAIQRLTETADKIPELLGMVHALLTIPPAESPSQNVAEADPPALQTNPEQETPSVTETIERVAKKRWI